MHSTLSQSRRALSLCEAKPHRLQSRTLARSHGCHQVGERWRLSEARQPTAEAATICNTIPPYITEAGRASTAGQLGSWAQGAGCRAGTAVRPRGTGAWGRGRMCRRRLPGTRAESTQPAPALTRWRHSLALWACGREVAWPALRCAGSPWEDLPPRDLELGLRRRAARMAAQARAGRTADRVQAGLQANPRCEKQTSSDGAAHTLVTVPSPSLSIESIICSNISLEIIASSSPIVERRRR